VCPGETVYICEFDLGSGRPRHTGNEFASSEEKHWHRYSRADVVQPFDQRQHSVRRERQGSHRGRNRRRGEKSEHS